MAQIIDEPNWGGVAGQSFSSGLQNALSMLAQYKMQDLVSNRHLANNTGALEAKGYPRSAAQAIAATGNPQIISAAIKSGYQGNPESEKSSIAQSYGDQYNPGNILNNLDRLGQNNAPRQEIIPASTMNAQKTPQEIKNQIFPQDEQNKNYIKNLANPLLNQQQKQPGFGQVSNKEEQRAQSEAVKEENKPSEYLNIPSEIPTALPPIDPTGMTAAQYKDARKTRHEIEQQNEKAGEKFWEDRLKSKETLPEQEYAINEMLKIREKGKLPAAKEWKLLTELEENTSKVTAAGTAAGASLGASIGGVTGLLGGPAVIPAIAGGSVIGGGVGAVVGYLSSLYAGLRKSDLREGNPDIARYEKYAATLVKQIPIIFKGTISEAVLSAYMDTIPTLAVDNAGAKMILKDIKSGIDLTKKLNNTADRIYAKNDYKIPRGFQYLTLKQHEPEVEKWIKGLQKTVDLAENLPKTGE